MSHWPHLEAPDSIIEVLWDVALIAFAIRLACHYAGLTLGLISVSIFLGSFLLNLYYNHTISFIDAPEPHPLTLPLLTLAASAVSAIFVIRRCDIPRVLVFRLAVGVGAAVMVGLGVGAVCLVRWEVLWTAVMEAFGGWKGAAPVMVGVMLMPVGMMGWEKLWEEVVGGGDGGGEGGKGER